MRTFLLGASFIAASVLAACEEQNESGAVAPASAPTAEAAEGIAPAVAQAGPVVVSVPPWKPQIELLLECDPLQQWEAFSRKFRLQAAGDRYEGSAGAKDTKWWDSLKLIIRSDNTFVLDGEYADGGDVTKSMNLTGAVVDGVLNGEGNRGRRICRISGEISTDQS